MKKCPLCDEENLIEAINCRYCGDSLEDCQIEDQGLVANNDTENKTDTINNFDAFKEFTKEYIASYRIPDGDGDVSMNMTIWYFIQRITDLSDEERKQAIAYLQTMMAILSKDGVPLWSEIFCLLALLYEKIEDKARAYYCYEEAINSPGVDNEIYRTYFVGMLAFGENFFIQEHFVEKWVKKYPNNIRPYRDAFGIYYEKNNHKCLEMIEKMKELDIGTYECLGLEDIEKELLELLGK